MRQDRADMYVLFSFVWGVSELFHQAILSYTWLHFGFAYVFGWILTGAALLLVHRPSSPYRLLFLALADVVWQFQQMPYVPNHIFFGMLVNLTIVLALGGPLVRHAIGAVRPEALLDRFGAPVRLELILLYAFAALAKLNYDFMNPHVSCGAVMLRETLDRIGLSITSDFVPTVSIWTTIVLESLVPALLVVRKTRSAGIIIGAVFHLILSLHPVPGIYGFSVMSMALYVLFVPPPVATVLKHWWLRWQSDWRIVNPRWLKTNLSVAIAAALVILAVSGVVAKSLGVAGRPLIELYLGRAVFVLWLIWGLSQLIVFCAVVWMQRAALAHEPMSTRQKSSFAAWLVPVVVVFTGLNPYLGLRTETSFAMFSNLRTEGGRTNHLFMPLSWHVATWQDDLVQIIDPSSRALGSAPGEDVLLPYFLFRSLTSHTPGHFLVQYRRNGEIHSFDSANEPGHELLRRPPWLLRKWLHFRPIDREGPMTCRH